MPAAQNQHRRQEIEKAAFEVLIDKGYGSTSMLAVAKKANASNETLYRWYGDKVGLISALIDGHAAAIHDKLADNNQDPLAALKEIGPTLYRLLMSERAMTLNRCAAADPTGRLEKALDQISRATIAPKLGILLNRARERDHIVFGTTAEAVALYLDLLVGDRQRRVWDANPATCHADTISARTHEAHARFLVLLSPSIYPGWQPKYRAKR